MATKTETKTKTEAKTKETGFEAFGDFFKAPAFDFTAVTEFHRKNVEAFVEAGRVAFDGSKAVSQKNVDLLKDTLADLNEFATETFNAKTPENGFQRSIEVSQTLVQKNVSAVRDVADSAAEVNQKVLAVLQDRYTAGVDEVKSASAK